jgi:hypothetical protein
VESKKRDCGEINEKICEKECCFLKIYGFPIGLVFGNKSTFD